MARFGDGVIEKRSRVKAPKVRTGCKTCKRRRVKCDETKPFCSRCITFGTACNGYLPDVKSLPTSRKIRNIVPKVTSQSSHPTPLEYPPARLLFDSEEQHRYFNVFCSQSADQLFSQVTSSMWQTIVLQACEDEPPLRHVVVALGALITSPIVDTKESKTLRRQFGFLEYSKAISKIRQRVATPAKGENAAKRKLRTTLIACFLFTCFESFNGFYESAVTQIFAGCKLIEEWQRQQSQLAYHATNVSSPEPLVIEHELVQAFGRLEIEAMSYRDTRGSGFHQAHGNFGQLSFDNMPAEFTTLLEARSYLYLVVHRGVNFSAWMQGESDFKGAMSLRNIKCGFKSSPYLKERCNEYARWLQAFQPLWRLSRTQEGSSTFIGASALRLHWLTCCLWRAVLAGGTSALYGQYSHELEEVLLLSRIIIQSSRSSNKSVNLGLHFDTQVIIIPPLQTLGYVYRDRRLRREAFRLLSDKPWKEGLHDSWVVGRTIKWLADLEDEGLPSEDELEYVPEENVIKDVKMHHDHEKRQTKVTGLQPAKGEKEVFAPREVIIPWL